MFKLALEGADDFAATLLKMERQLAELHRRVPEVLVEWQIEDLGRRHPNMTVEHSENKTTAMTRVWRGPGAKVLKRRGRRKFREKDWLRVNEGVSEGGEFVAYVGPQRRRRRRSRKRSKWWAKEGEVRDRTTDPAVREGLNKRMTDLLEEPQWQST